MDQRLGDKRTWILAGLGAVIAVSLVAGAWSLFGGGSEATSGPGAEHPDGIGYYCPQCKKGFVLSTGEFEKHQKDHWGEPVPCPECGHKPPEPGTICPACKAVYAHDRANPTRPCPHCGKAPK